jgi:F-type H+-transporting ATPase subunit alpha
VLSIFAGVNGFLDTVPVRDITRFEAAMLSAAKDKIANVLKDIDDTGALSDESTDKLKSFIGDFVKSFA